jgi:hypothetical protein
MSTLRCTGNSPPVHPCVVPTKRRRGSAKAPVVNVGWLQDARVPSGSASAPVYAREILRKQRPSDEE